MVSYKVEISPNNRAVCQDTHCKASGEKLKKGEVRFGTWVEISTPEGVHQSWKYKHWGCVTPKIIENINEFLEGNMELLEGYEALDEAWQDKITKALEQGHVDDRDWTGDLEFNRPGKTGKFPRAKKGKKAADTDAEDSEAKPTPKKKAPAKKRKAKVEEDKEDEEVEEDAKPAPKKRKSAATKAKVEPETDGGDAVKPTKRGPGRPKKPEGTGKAKPSVPHGRPRGRPKMPEGTTKPAYVPNGRPRFGRAE